MSHISRRDFLKRIAAGAACATAFPALAAEPLSFKPGAGRAAPPDYNVLFLMSDEHSPFVAGCYGDKIVRTPALDSLAQTGVLFTAAYTQNPVCVPSRLSFLTGKMPCHVTNDAASADQSRLVRNNRDMTLGKFFAAHGYVTLWAGKEHWDRAFAGFGTMEKSASKAETERIAALGPEAEERKKAATSRSPKDAFIAPWPASAEGDTYVKEMAVKFLQDNADKKFFLGVSFRKPHFPYYVQQEYYNLYKDSAIPAPRVTRAMLDDLPEPMKQDRDKYGIPGVSEEEARKARAIYYGMVTYVDDQINDILKKLDDLKLRDETIILYTADHGEMLGQHGIWYKNCFYEGAARVPFLWSCPKETPENKTVDAPVMNMDIFPTLCEMCGLQPPEGLEGKSLAPLMKGTEDGKDRYALSENRRNGMHSRMIRTAQWKYFYYEDGREWLFDMQNDPGEEHNLAHDPQRQDLLRELKQRALRGWTIPSKDREAGASQKEAEGEDEA